jgi:HlyD family secretion protein
MRRGRNAWRYGLVGVGVLLALACVTFAVMPSFFGFVLSRRAAPLHLATTPVRRTDLCVTMTTGGRVDSSDKTIIECELENVFLTVRGYGMGVGGSSTILSVVPDGSMVKKGDLLCRLDASAYDELVRTQMMNVERGRADFNQAKLGLEVAQMAVTEYCDGLMGQARKSLNGQMTLNQSDYERAVGRLAWTRHMVESGYLPKAQLTTDEFALNRLALNIKQGRTALDLFERFSAPKYIFMLKTDVLGAEAVYNYQDRRFRFFEEQLALYKKQVERCTIVAPHDGFVIYANDELRNIHIEPGMLVRQKQRLFYLPNLAQMEVAAMLHESVVKEVKPGMRVRVKIEALPNRVLEGHIDAITQIPERNWFSDVKYFYGTVKLHNVPKGLRPGMTAEVEIVTANKPDVLVIPAESLTVEDGHDFCYVSHDDTLERREVKLGQSTRDYLEVTEGLDEGEAIVLDPELATSPVTIADSGDDAAGSRPPEEASSAKTGE